MSEIFSIGDFDFPLLEKWVNFTHKYPMRQLHADPYVKMCLFDWLLVGNELADDSWGASDEIYQDGIAFIYGLCLCFLFQGKWVYDSKTSDYLIVYNSFESWRVITSPMSRVKQLQYDPTSEKFIRMLIIDCFSTHFSGRFDRDPKGHPLFQFYDNEEKCTLSVKAKALIKQARLDIFDLLRLAHELSFWGFDFAACSKEIESNSSLFE
jgi:hypothetical protein